MKKHTHKAVTSVTRAYTGPVAPDENRAAHGGVCIVEECSCGAARCTNSNGGHLEEGPWIEPESFEREDS